MRNFLYRTERLLDAVYIGAAYLSGLCLVFTLILIDAQIVLRQFDIAFPGVASYSGYLLGASIFFGCAYTLRSDGHVRVELLLDRLGQWRFLGLLWTYFVGALVMLVVAWSIYDGLFWSLKFGDVSSGIDATPLWIPQVVLFFGAVLFLICLVDGFVRCWVYGDVTPISNPTSDSEDNNASG